MGEDWQWQWTKNLCDDVEESLLARENLREKLYVPDELKMLVRLVSTQWLFDLRLGGTVAAKRLILDRPSLHCALLRLHLL